MQNSIACGTSAPKRQGLTSSICAALPHELERLDIVVQRHDRGTQFVINVHDEQVFQRGEFFPLTLQQESIDPRTCSVMRRRSWRCPEYSSRSPGKMPRT